MNSSTADRRKSDEFVIYYVCVEWLFSVTAWMMSADSTLALGVNVKRSPGYCLFEMSDTGLLLGELTLLGIP